MRIFYQLSDRTTLTTSERPPNLQLPFDAQDLDALRVLEDHPAHECHNVVADENHRDLAGVFHRHENETDDGGAHDRRARRNPDDQRQFLDTATCQTARHRLT